MEDLIKEDAVTQYANDFFTSFLNASLFTVFQKETAPLEQPFVLAGKKFSFSNNIKTKDWIQLLSVVQQVTAAIIKSNTDNESEVGTNMMIKMTDLLSDYAFKYLIYHPDLVVAGSQSTQLPEGIVGIQGRSIDMDYFDSLMQGNPDGMLIPKYFFQHINFLINKSNLSSKNIQK